MDPKPYDVPPDQQAGGPTAQPFEPSHLPGTPPRQRPEKVKKKKGGSFAQQRPKGNPRKNRAKKKK